MAMRSTYLFNLPCHSHLPVQHRRAWVWVVLVLGTIEAGGLIGCGQSGPKLVPVSGVVTLDGQPLSDAGILFQPIGGGPPASGTTDASGRFTLRTQNRPGAVLGEHRVSITKFESTGTGMGVAGNEPVRMRWLLPEKYTRPETSGITVKVTGHQEDVVLTLSSK